MCAVSLLVADDHEIVRRGIRALIQEQPEWQIAPPRVHKYSVHDCGREASCDRRGRSALARTTFLSAYNELGLVPCS